MIAPHEFTKPLLAHLAWIDHQISRSEEGDPDERSEILRRFASRKNARVSIGHCPPTFDKLSPATLKTLTRERANLMRTLRLPEAGGRTTWSLPELRIAFDRWLEGLNDDGNSSAPYGG